MTGPRRLRGRLDDDRHGRGERPTHEPVGTHTELEELSVGRVTTRGRTRPGLQATFAAGALVALLALGFGVFGGRRPPSEGAAASTTAMSPSAPTLAAGETPAVTPSTPCTPPPASPPEVFLTWEDIAVPAIVEVLEQPRGVPVSGAAPTGTSLPGEARRTRVPAEVAAAIWLAGATCANAWTIRVGSELIDAQGNPGLDPAYAAQNRFELYLAPNGGTVTDLEAELIFPAMVVRATWPLIINPYPVPEAFFATDRGERWGAIQGCDLQVSTQVATFGIRSGCQGSLSSTGERPAMGVRSRAALTFEIEGDQFSSAFVSCGVVHGLDYVATPAAGCVEGEYYSGQGSDAGVIRFTGPANGGIWTIAVVTCASPAVGGNESICGTWYADVQVGTSIEGFSVAQ